MTDYKTMYECAVEFVRSLIREANDKDEKIRALEVEARELRERAEELRFNPNHDPANGRFTSGNGVDISGESGIIKETKGQKALREKIESGELPLKINPDKQSRHILQSGEISKPDGRSYLTIDLPSAQAVIDEYHATGDVVHIPSSHKFKELITTNKEIGVDGRSNQKTKQAFINYSKTGTHIVPTKKGRKDD